MNFISTGNFFPQTVILFELSFLIIPLQYFVCTVTSFKLFDLFELSYLKLPFNFIRAVILYY